MQGCCLQFSDPSNIVAACERSLQAHGHEVFALGALALLIAVSVITAKSVDREADLEKAEELISRALALDADCGIAHLAKSHVLIARNRHEQAISEAERALALSPDYIGTRPCESRRRLRPLRANGQSGSVGLPEP